MTQHRTSHDDAPFVAGISHRTATLNQLAACAVPHDRYDAFAAAIRPPGVAPLVLLSTCNRTEAYGLSPTPRETAAQVQAAMRRAFADNGATGLADDAIYTHTERAAVAHLFRVVSGLDAMILGETEIAHQVQRAFACSTSNHRPAPRLTQLFSAAYRTGKRVRTETRISEGATSMASAAVHLARHRLGDLRRHTALLIGSGDTGTSLAKHLRHQCAHLRIANRTDARAQTLAELHGGEAVPFAALPDALTHADVVFCAVSAAAPIIDRAALSSPRTRPLLLVDISLPRAVAPDVASLPDVALCDMNAIQTVVAANIERREAQLPTALHIVDEEVGRFLEAQNLRSAAPLIRALHHAFEQLRQDELQRHDGKLADSEKARLDRISRALRNRRLHQPTVAIRSWAASNDHSDTQLAWVAELFDLRAATPEEEPPS